MTEASNQRVRGDARSIEGGNLGRWALRAGIVVLLLAAGAVIGLAGERLLGGIAPNEMRISTFQDWRVICPPLTQTTPNCALTSDVMRDTGGTLLTLSVLDPTPGKEISLTVPHGVLLAPGLGFAIGNEPTRVRPYETCSNQGCIALVTIDGDTLKALNANMGGHVSVAVPNNAQPVNIPFSLKGFSDGFGELQRAKSRRTGMLSFLNRS
jgi:invasion protein IalB